MRFFVGRGQSNLCVNKSHEGLVKQRASLRTVAALASISTCESKKQVLFLKLIRTDPKCHLHCSRWPNFWGFWESFSAAASTSTSSRSLAASCANGARGCPSRSASSFLSWPSPPRFSLDTSFSMRWSKDTYVHDRGSLIVLSKTFKNAHFLAVSHQIWCYTNQRYRFSSCPFSKK